MSIELNLGHFAVNLNRIQREVSTLATSRGHSPPKIVIITKYLDLAATRQLVEAGFRTLGENRAQDFATKSREILSSVEWHFVGHIQRNKLSMLLPQVHTIHSFDSVRLLEACHNYAAKEELEPVRGFVQVNVSGEQSKGGFSEKVVASELPNWQDRFPKLELIGLMTIPPRGEPEATREIFRRLRGLRDDLREKIGGSGLGQLSMGMSEDYRIATEEGATALRLGRVLYEDSNG